MQPDTPLLTICACGWSTDLTAQGAIARPRPTTCPDCRSFLHSVPVELALATLWGTLGTPPFRLNVNEHVVVLAIRPDGIVMLANSQLNVN
jgi:hypothetical protein